MKRDEELPGVWLTFDSLPTHEELERERRQAIIDFDVDKLRDIHRYLIESKYFENEEQFMAYIHSSRLCEPSLSVSERRASAEWLFERGLMVNEYGNPVRIVWKGDDS